MEKIIKKIIGSYSLEKEEIKKISSVLNAMKDKINSEVETISEKDKLKAEVKIKKIQEGLEEKIVKQTEKIVEKNFEDALKLLGISAQKVSESSVNQTDNSYKSFQNNESNSFNNYS